MCYSFEKPLVQRPDDTLFPVTIFCNISLVFIHHISQPERRAPNLGGPKERMTKSMLGPSSRRPQRPCFIKTVHSNILSLITASYPMQCLLSVKSLVGRGCGYWMCAGRRQDMPIYSWWRNLPVCSAL